MNPHFDTVTIIGVGLLGGSLGLAMKERGIVNTVRGVGHRQSSLDEALKIGSVDEIYFDTSEASQNADLVVICTPAALVLEKMDEILSVCSPKAVVTDVASTKADICKHARKIWPEPLRFIGSHPMAGSEKYGAEHSFSKLYEGAVTFVEQGDHLDTEARQTVIDLWTALGSCVVDIEPDLHDNLVARTSHIPHILSSSMALLASRKGNVRPFVGTGFRDFTRVAEGRPEIWRDICLTNNQAIIEGLDELMECLEKLRSDMVDSNGDELYDFFLAGRQARKKVIDE